MCPFRPQMRHQMPRRLLLTSYPSPAARSAGKQPSGRTSEAWISFLAVVLFFLVRQGFFRGSGEIVQRVLRELCQAFIGGIQLRRVVLGEPEEAALCLANGWHFPILSALRCRTDH